MPMPRAKLLLVVDDWEALERYEDRLSPHFGETEAWPLGSEGLRRATEEAFDLILIDLTLEDLTPQEAQARLMSQPARGEPRVIYVGEPSELSGITEGGRVSKVLRPFDWAGLQERVLNAP